MPASDGTTWLKVILDKTHCVEEVIWYYDSGTPVNTWTCSDSDCSICVGYHCADFPLSVRIEGAGTDLSSVLNCRYGDTVKLERKDGSEHLNVVEISIIGKTGTRLENC